MHRNSEQYLATSKFRQVIILNIASCPHSPSTSLQHCEYRVSLLSGRGVGADEIAEGVIAAWVE